ncbi:MAG: ribonuclease J [Sandaracinaceae bacterium]|nr:ribonuclease J [Sandaracinaceae bacterium]
MPLGGLGEIGMNCMAIEQGDDRIVVDCGIAFDGRGLGVDVLRPDWSWLASEPEKLRALVLTHGHEDHIGAVPFFLREFDVPVYGPPYALSLVRERLAELPPKTPPVLHETVPGGRYPIGPFEIEPFRVTHSMPDCTGLVIRSPAGVCVHTGDFKLDDAPTDGQTFDAARLEEIARSEGVALLLSDSTNSIAPGSSRGERLVGERLETLVREAEGRVIVSLFASNVHRLRALAAVARATGRRICCIGRSLETHARLARAHGHLDELEAVRIPRELARTTPRDRLIVLATGTQAEPAAALARLAADAHPDLRLESGDRVIHSARIIPGNERAVYDVINALVRRGVEVRWAAMDPDVHVSGHAHQEEQRRMLEIVRPQAFLPIHGTYVHLKRHAEIARETGVGEIAIVENGGVVELEGGTLREAGRVPHGRVYVARGGAPLSERVLKDRALLAELGVAVVTILVDGAGRPVGELDLLTRGVVHEEDDAEVLDEACDYVFDALARARRFIERPDEEALELEARRALKRFFARRLGRKPLCYAVVMRVPT